MADAATHRQTSQQAAKKIRVVEVGPRDGLQNEKVRVPTPARVELVERLADAGLRDIEIGSFVHPKWVPQMADTDEVARRIRRRAEVRYWALIPNPKGLESALQANIQHAAVFLSSSESHNQKNLNRSIAESLQNVEEVLRAAHAQGMVTRGYISTVFGCPYEGEVPFDRVLKIAEQLLHMGVSQVSLGDTTGMGVPLQVRDGCRRAVETFGTERVALHLHDTRGLGLVNALQGLEAGITTFDSSLGGMGGCPYAPGASGNLGTEDLLYMLQHLGCDTGVDLNRVVALSRDLELEYGTTMASKFFRYAAGRL